MSEFRRLIASAAICGSVALVVAAASTATVAPGTVAMKVLPADVEVPPETPAECAGMRFAVMVIGTDGDDVLTSGNGGALIFGKGGNDTIAGGNGKDCIVGGEGDDLLDGANGDDVLLGGPGNDMISGGNGADLIVGGAGVDDCDDGNGPDAINECEGPSPVAEPVDGTGSSPHVPGLERAVRDPRGPRDPALPTPDLLTVRARLLAPCPDDAACVIYVVHRGDNLVSIVRFFEVTLEDTLKLNPWLEDPADLVVGAELRLPWPDWLPARPDAAGGASTPMPEPTATSTIAPTAEPIPEPPPEASSEPTSAPIPNPTPEATTDPTPDPNPDPTPTPPEPDPTP